MMLLHWLLYGAALMGVAAFIRVVIGVFRAIRKHVPEPTTVTTVDPLFVALQHGECPDCGGDVWYMGPRGGLGQNITCANDTCGSRFNVAPCDGEILGQLLIAERIGQPKCCVEGCDKPARPGSDMCGQPFTA